MSTLTLLFLLPFAAVANDAACEAGSCKSTGSATLLQSSSGAASVVIATVKKTDPAAALEDENEDDGDDREREEEDEDEEDDEAEEDEPEDEDEEDDEAEEDEPVDIVNDRLEWNARAKSRKRELLEWVAVVCGTAVCADEVEVCKQDSFCLPGFNRAIDHYADGVKPIAEIVVDTVAQGMYDYFMGISTNNTAVTNLQQCVTEHESTFVQCLEEQFTSTSAHEKSKRIELQTLSVSCLEEAAPDGADCQQAFAKLHDHSENDCLMEEHDDCRVPDWALIADGQANLSDVVQSAWNAFQHRMDIHNGTGLGCDDENNYMNFLRCFDNQTQTADD